MYICTRIQPVAAWGERGGGVADPAGKVTKSLKIAWDQMEEGRASLGALRFHLD